VLDELGQGRRELDDLAGLEHGRVAMAAELLPLLDEVLAGFLAGHPGVSRRLSQSTALAMAGLLHAGQVDFCLASQPLDDDALGSAELASEEVLVAVPRPIAWAAVSASA